MSFKIFFSFFIAVAAVGIVLFFPSVSRAGCYTILVAGDCGNNGNNGTCAWYAESTQTASCKAGTTLCEVCTKAATCTVTSTTCGACSVSASNVACGATVSGTKSCTDNCGGVSSQSCSVTGTYCASGTCSNGSCVVAAPPPPAPVAPVAASSQITSPAAGTWQGSGGFNVSVTDTNASICYYRVYSDPSGWTGVDPNTGRALTRTCSTSVSPVSIPISVGSSGFCRDESTAAKPTPCQVQVASYNSANQLSPWDYRAYGIDFTPPLAPTSLTFDQNPNTDGTPTIRWSGASDALSGIVSYDIKHFRASEVIIGNIAGTEWTPSSALENGSYIVQVRAKDRAGNISGWFPADGSIILTVSVPSVDSSAPAVIISGAPQNWQNTNATMNIVCNDGTGSGCEVAANWKYYTNVNQINSCSAKLTDYIGTYSASGIAISSHLWICATAADANGNRGYSAPMEFKVDKIIPLVNANNASDSWFVSRSANLTVSDSGGAGLVEGRYSWDSNAMNAVCASGGAVFTSGTSLTVSEGSHRLYLCARDNVGNVATWDSGANKYRVDSVAPTVSSFTINGITNTSFDIAWTASDNSGGSGIQRQEIWRATDIDGDGQPNWPGIAFVPNTISPYTDNPPEGVYWYGLHIVDNASNCITDAGGHCGGVASDFNDTRTARGPLKVMVDKTLPSSATLQVTPSNPGVGETINITVSANDALSGISLLLAYYGGNWTSSGPCPVGTNSCSYTFTTRELAVGSKTYSSYVYDRAGNGIVTTPSSVTVTVEPGLTYPPGFWQRLWYATSGASPVFSTGNFLREGPDESIEKFTTDWGNGLVPTMNNFNKSDNIGFKSSRMINFATPGRYSFTIGSDDGVRLFLDEALTPFCDQWSDGEYRTKSCDQDISTTGNHKIRLDYYENTGSAKVSFGYALLPTAPAPSGVSTDLSDTSIYVSWGSVSGVTNATYRLEWCKKSVIDGGGSFSSPGCGPPNSPDTSNPPYFISTTSTSGYIIGTDAATAYNLRVRAENGTSSQYIFPGSWAAVNNVVTRTPKSCSNVDPTNTASGSSVTDDCFYVERRCSALDVNDGCVSACIIGNNYLSTGSNPITKIGTVARGKWRVTGTASLDLFARGHGVRFLECIGADWRSWISRANAVIYLKNSSTTLDTTSSSQSLSWAVTGEGWQEFTWANNPVALSFDKVFDCAYVSCDLYFYSSFSGNAWTHRAFFPGGSGDYVRQTALMDYNILWTFVDEIAPDAPVINTPQNQWRKGNTAVNVTVTDNIGVAEIGYAIKGKDCDFTKTPTPDPCVDGDWKKAQKGDLLGDLAPNGTSVTVDWKISAADWGRFNEGSNTLYLRVKDAAGNCRGCDNATRIEFGIKKDTLAPSSILNVAGAKTGTDSAGRHWFNVGKSISVVDKDNKTPGAGNYSDLYTTACYYKIQDLERCPLGADPSTCSNNSYTSGFRTCGSAVSVTIGSSATGVICQIQGLDPFTGLGYCGVFVQSYDLAGNSFGYWERLNIDYTPPGVQ